MEAKTVVDMKENLSTYYEGLCRELSHPRVLRKINNKYGGGVYGREAVAKVALDYLLRNRDGMLYTEYDSDVGLYKWPYKIDSKFDEDGGWIEIVPESREELPTAKLSHADIHIGKGEHYTERFDINPESYLVIIESYVRTDKRFHKPGIAEERSIYEVKPEVINENSFPRLIAEVRELEKDFIYRDNSGEDYRGKTSEDEVICHGSNLVRKVIRRKQEELSELEKLAREFPETAKIVKEIKDAKYNLKLGDVNAYGIEREGDKWFEENSKVRDEGEVADVATGISSSDMK